MFDRIETKTKTSFTKEYNKQHQEIKRLGGQKGKKAAAEEQGDVADAKSAEDADDVDSAESDDGDVLLDENELAELKKAK